MGGLGGVMGLLMQNGMPPSNPQSDIEQAASQAPQQLGQALQNQQQSQPDPTQAPQQAQQPAQQPDALDQLKDSLVQQYKANQPPPPSGGPVRHLLQNFFSGMGHSMMKEGGLPTPQDKQNMLLNQIQGVTSAQSNVELHKMMAGQYAPVPLVGLDGKPVTDPTTGKVISLPQNHAATYYAALQAAASRVQVQTQKGDTAEDIQGQKGDLAQSIQGQRDDSALALASQRNANAAMIARGHDLAKVESTKMALQARANMAKDPNALTNTMKTMKQQAQSTLPGIDRALDETKQVSDRLGPVAGRWNDFWQGKVGASDPQFAHYKDEIGLVSSAVTLAHARGRMSGELYQHFQQMFDAGKQSPENMTQALNVAKEWLTDYANMGNAPASPQIPNSGGLTPFQQWKAKQK